MYEKMMALMEKYGVRLVCAGRWDVSSETGEKTLGLCPPKEEVISGEELVRRIFHWENIDSAAWDKLYHKSLFASVRYPLGVICEDVPTTYRIALDAGQAAMLPAPFTIITTGRGASPRPRFRRKPSIFPNILRKSTRL